MAVQLGSRVLFVRGAKALEGRVFAVREGACSVEGPGNRAYYLERWEVLLVLGLDEEYARWLNTPPEGTLVHSDDDDDRKGHNWPACRTTP